MSSTDEDKLGKRGKVGGKDTVIIEVKTKCIWVAKESGG